MDVVFLVGRILFSFLFVMSGLTGHLQNRELVTGYARSAGAPAPALMVPATGVAIIVGGLAVALGVWADLAALGIAAFTVSTAFIIHGPWKQRDPQMRQQETVHFMKDLALAGAALFLFYAYNQLQGDAGLSLTDPLFDRGD